MNTKELIDRLNFAATDVPVKAARELCKEAADAIERLTQPVGEAEPESIDWPEYHHEGMGCGLEDRCITDRYEAMRYGWDAAIERVAEILPDQSYSAASVARLIAERDKARDDATEWKAKFARLETLQDEILAELNKEQALNNTLIAERDAAQHRVLRAFFHDEVPIIQQGWPAHELEEFLTAEQVTSWVQKIDRLTKELDTAKMQVATELVDQVQAQQETITRLTAERDTCLQAMDQLAAQANESAYQRDALQEQVKVLREALLSISGWETPDGAIMSGTDACDMAKEALAATEPKEPK